MNPAYRITCFWLLWLGGLASLLINQAFPTTLLAWGLACLIRDLKPKLPGPIDSLQPRTQLAAIVIVGGIGLLDAYTDFLPTLPKVLNYSGAVLIFGFAIWLDFRAARKLSPQPPPASEPSTTA